MSDKKSRTKKASIKSTRERIRRAKINNYIEDLRDVLKYSIPFMVSLFTFSYFLLSTLLQQKKLTLFLDFSLKHFFLLSKSY